MTAIKYFFKPLNVNQTLSYTVSVGTASAVGSQTYAVMLHASSDCYVSFGTTGSAAASATAGAFLKADEPYTFDCIPGQIISAIRKSADGTLEISELTQ